jgi:predicted metal-dependent HD superfamily phosphohydrolase
MREAVRLAYRRVAVNFEKGLRYEYDWFREMRQRSGRTRDVLGLRWRLGGPALNQCAQRYVHR